MNDKLVKNSTTIETAEAFAKAIGRAIGENDVETAKVLSGELRESVENGIPCKCGHSASEHVRTGEFSPCAAKVIEFFSPPWMPHPSAPGWFWSNPADGGTNDVRNGQCSCTQYEPTEVALALRKENASGRVPIIVEGKHFARLRSVYFDTILDGRRALFFKLDIVKSRTMNPCETMHVMPLDRGLQMSIALAQLERLSIDRQSVIDGDIRNANLDVVVLAIPKKTKTGRTIMSIQLRYPEAIDSEEIG